MTIVCDFFSACTYQRVLGLRCVRSMTHTGLQFDIDHLTTRNILTSNSHRTQPRALCDVAQRCGIQRLPWDMMSALACKVSSKQSAWGCLLSCSLLCSDLSQGVCVRVPVTTQGMSVCIGGTRVRYVLFLPSLPTKCVTVCVYVCMC